MGRKRLDKNKRKGTLNLSITQEVIDEFKQECERKEELQSHVVEYLIKKYILNKKV